MFTYRFSNTFICIFISLLLYFFFITNGAKFISRPGTIKFYCIVLYFCRVVCTGQCDTVGLLLTVPVQVDQSGRRSTL